MNQFFRKWTENNKKQEFLFASDDNAFCELLRLAIDVQKHENFTPLNSYLTESGYIEAKKFLDTDVNNVERVYWSETWGPEYRKNLISKYEKKLFLN